MHFAVDAGSLGPGNGIGRYATALLSRMLPAAAASTRWTLYARDAAPEWHGSKPAFRQANVELRLDGMPRNLGRVVSLATTQPWWLARDPPDVFWGPAHRLPLWMPRTTARVVTIHDLCWLRAPETMRAGTRWLDRTLMPRALHTADRVIAVSNSTRDALVEHFPSVAGRVVVVHEACEAMPVPGAPVIDGPYVLCVGTIEPRKNLARLIEAFARVEGDARLVIAGGPGWGGEVPDAMPARAGIAERVTWLGAVDDRTLATLYAHAAFLAMPSLYEGFGLPILEALSHGTPVLFGDNSSMPEVAGDAGLAVDAGSVDSIAQGLSMLLHDEALRASLAGRARAQAAKFSWDRAARETLAVFDEALAARRAR